MKGLCAADDAAQPKSASAVRGERSVVRGFRWSKEARSRCLCRPPGPASTVEVWNAQRRAQSTSTESTKAESWWERTWPEGQESGRVEISEALNTSGTLPDATAGRDQLVGRRVEGLSSGQHSGKVGGGFCVGRSEAEGEDEGPEAMAMML